MVGMPEVWGWPHDVACTGAGRSAASRTVVGSMPISGISRTCSRSARIVSAQAAVVRLPATKRPHRARARAASGPSIAWV